MKNLILQAGRILLAEDNDLNAEIAMTILEENGFLAERAEDGQICVEMDEKCQRPLLQPDPYGHPDAEHEWLRGCPGNPQIRWGEGPHSNHRHDRKCISRKTKRKPLPPE